MPEEGAAQVPSTTAPVAEAAAAPAVAVAAAVNPVAAVPAKREEPVKDSSAAKVCCASYLRLNLKSIPQLIYGLSINQQLNYDSSMAEVLILNIKSLTYLRSYQAWRMKCARLLRRSIILGRR